MAIFPPTERIWWNEPVEKSEVLWVTIALLWALIMFFMMPYWHIVGKQNLSNEAYRITPEAYSAKVDAMVKQYTVRSLQTKTGASMPVVHPPAGGDAYLQARLWEWFPVIEFEKGKSYRLHLSSLDWIHGFSLQPENINIQVHPNYEMVVTITPTSSGEFTVICNEFCGIGHHTMVGKILVVDSK
jgi:cytochrome c oxidase subunit 2